MIKQDRVKRLLAAAGKTGLLFSDPYNVNWLIGKMIASMERFLAVYLSPQREPILFVNELFRFDDDIGIKKVYYADGEDIIPLLKKYINPCEKLGVDGKLPARFLLPMMEEGIAEGFVDGSAFIDKERARKDEEEKQLMRKASLLNDQAMDIFKTLVGEGISEKAVAAKIEGIYISLGAEGNSFEPIVAFGKNSADPHHIPDSTTINEGDTVLFDVGCVYKGYCSDMTRTFFYKKEPEGEARKIYELVHKANEEAEKAVKPGIRLCDIDGIARGIISDAGYGEDFTHRLGHFIGTEVHEAGDVSGANESLVEEGNTFSIEPGIYNAAAGVRIEDLVLVEKDHTEVLNHYGKDIEVIG